MVYANYSVQIFSIDSSLEDLIAFKAKLKELADSLANEMLKSNNVLDISVEVELEETAGD